MIRKNNKKKKSVFKFCEKKKKRTEFKQLPVEKQQNKI